MSGNLLGFPDYELTPFKKQAKWIKFLSETAAVPVMIQSLVMA